MMPHKGGGLHPIMRAVRFAKVTKSGRQKLVMPLCGWAHEVS